ncbi:hypothetical protein ABT256_34490 [Amycolatopsis japonica]|uniref:hypothetical protein n=1 Tax=Amycolatopsis japonica TaxID=208439 RepID=UPI00331AC913
MTEVPVGTPTAQNEAILGTDRDCPTFLTNYTGKTITVNEIRHMFKGKPTSVKTDFSLDNHQRVPVFTSYYETGAGTSFDYWYIDFTDGEDTYTVPSNFYCSLTKFDEGMNVELSFDLELFYVNPPQSSSCRKTLDKS